MKYFSQLDDLTTHIDTLESLLRGLYPKLDLSSAQLVDRTLMGMSPRSPFPEAYFRNPNASTVPPSHTQLSRVFPLRGVDYTEEDFNRDKKVQATGYVGEFSEIAWLYRLKRDLDQHSSTEIKQAPGSPAISSADYFQDNQELSILDYVDLSCWPSQHIADVLVDAYFHAVHPTFPIIGKTIFLDQYRTFYSKTNSRPHRTWLALLNLVFSIAARHMYLTDQSHIDGDDHRSFFARAWKLGIGNVAFLDHSNLQQVQVEGLAALYLLSVGQVNRSWKMIGAAIRSAMTMGLNFRSQSESVPHFSKELRYRLWWALFMLETVLLDLAHLLREAIENLYASRVAQQSWDEIEPAITTLNNRADDWLSHLPTDFDFTTPNTSHRFAQQRANLGFQFYATRLIITQPSLRSLSVQSSEARSLGARCDNLAAICVKAASQVLVLLPENTDQLWLDHLAPWWCILHNVMQSTTVLLVELFARTHPGTPKAAKIIDLVKKAIGWLKKMSVKDPASQRAWLVCKDILARHGSKFGLDKDLVAPDPAYR
ncbi:hypothetical protein N7508_011052 [Penicillium antarcticum]|uniref:uncharacterized protein n=1 Tax=Penicillium antarcticum TaxID=416450 RepID=UPI00238AC0B9|nr:uncharacterized protein N7508_011052 [Penicillium antarcticum]KAJ5288277.1 hypothetical protein N7508_011052 [Penicillium antarcticum]